MRIAAFLLLTNFLLVLLAPAWVVVDFWVQKDRIESELCVQRMVAGPQRTCHGDCYLMRQLHKTEQREQGMPTELRALRLGDMTAERPLRVPMTGVISAHTWPGMREDPRDGHPLPSEPVPWA